MQYSIIKYSCHAVGEGDGTPLQPSCLENPMDGGAWWAAVHGVAKGRTWLGDFTFTFHFHALGKEMATHSSVLAWRVPGTEEPGGLPSMGSHRVGHDWSDLAAAAAAMLYIISPGLIYFKPEVNSFWPPLPILLAPYPWPWAAANLFSVIYELFFFWFGFVFRFHIWMRSYTVCLWHFT